MLAWQQMGGANGMGVAAICWAVLSGACGSTDKGKPPEPPPSEPVPAPTGANGDSFIPELTAAQREEFCRGVRAYKLTSGAAASLAEWFYRSAGIDAAGHASPLPATDAEARELCQAAYDEYKAIGFEDTIDRDCDAEHSYCMATIDEFDACLAEEPDFAAALAMTYPSCDELTLEDLQPGAHSLPERPVACSALDKKCF